MALRLRVKSIDCLRERCDRFVKVSFRGVSYITGIHENESPELVIDELFDWPIATNLESNEILYLQLYNHNKYLSNKLIGNYGIILQKVIEEKELTITDNFTDDNNMPIRTKITFQVIYYELDSTSQISFVTYDDNMETLIDIDTQSLYPKSPKIRHTSPSRASLPSTMKSIANIMKIHKKSTKAEPEERLGLSSNAQPEYGSTMTVGSNDVLLNIDSTLSSKHSQESGYAQGFDSIPLSITTPVCVDKLQDKENNPYSSKAQDFQVCITIIEARHLAGLNMDPVVCVQVGDIKKYTSVKESTNCPYYNEYFVFDFHMSSAMLFDKMITLTVLYSRNIIRSGKVIGSFKLDVGTVFAQADHQFYHKWALLTDMDDIGSGAKGYLKCDLLVAGKGDAIKPPINNDSNDDDIEGNLLLPRGVIAERQHAKYVIRVYRADGLPRYKSGLVANVKKAISSDIKQLVSPYVQVSFAGMSSKTSIKKNCCNPVWNEQIVITEMFPPLCQRIKLQIRDSDPVSDTVIATHFIPLSKISNEGAKGFLPTYGPSFIYLYGSIRDGSIFEDQPVLNDGFSEGVMYRGRLMIAIHTEILESVEANISGVNMESASAINENNYGKSDEFLLFATIFDSNMIDRKYADKPLHYEISIGGDGIGEEETSHESNTTYENFDDKTNLYSNNISETQNLLTFVGQQNNYDLRSTTAPIRPVMTDRQYYHLPIESEKPCLYLRSSLPDHRRRAYNSNIIEKIANNLEIGLFDVQEMIRIEKCHTERRLRGVIEELMIDCSRFLTIIKGFGGSAIGKTKLDKERLLMSQREFESIISDSKGLKQNINENTIKDQLKKVYKILNSLKELAKDPQHSMPDIFIWLLCGEKRIAYQRLETKHYLFSIVDEECGKSCAKLHNVFLKLCGKKNDSMNGLIQNMLYVYLWFGNRKHKKYFARGLPKGYRMVEELQSPEKAHLLPPTTVYYECKHQFQLRAHIYQARSLFASDSSGLSDPFAKVLLSDSSQTTEVIEETLSPTWDQMLIFPDITVYGERKDLANNPPIIVIEIYDRDKVGKAEFIGRAVAKDCYIRFADQKYTTPQLQWFDVWRGEESAGQLLACFELIQLSPKSKTSAYPDVLPEYKPSLCTAVCTGNSVMYDNQLGVYPVPQSIRPTLSKYRIEVLFWGLRDLKRVQFMSVDRPRVDIECAGNILQSSLILNYKKNPNFMIPVKHIDLELPDQEMYCPPLTIRVMDCRSFGRFVLVGTHMIASLSKYAIKDLGKDLLSAKPKEVILDANQYCFNSEMNRKISKSHSKNSLKMRKNILNENTSEIFESEDEENRDRDWWSRYFASVDTVLKNNVSHLKCILDGFVDMKSNNFNNINANNHSNSHSKGKKSSNKSFSPKKSKEKSMSKQMADLIQIYSHELELCPHFDGFKEYLQSFELFRGKRYGNDSDDMSRLCGIFKGSIKLYRHPFSSTIFESRFTPSNEPINVLVRIYVVKGSDLHPADLNGKADPYVVINLGSKRVSDKDNYISKQLNPIFGKCFEFDATFPQDSMCTIQIYDWDLFGTDDLIGETKLDLENRFYSKHRATCGLSRIYENFGPNQWRDSLKPSQILTKLCKDHKLPVPVITPLKVKIGITTFRFGDPTNDPTTPIPLVSEEEMALAVLHNWAHITGDLVPEHIETRSLYNPDKPGIEQGKLEMWVDMFPKDGPSPPPAIDISPRKPKSYELRVIIWNTEDVLLEDDAFFTGEKMSDIYVKGWLKGPEDVQCTDIHYRSLTGEGNFNWRFVFPFNYLPAEEKIVISRKESMFSWDETECKIPARLFLQVWDADHFSADDFLGAITLDLNRFPRGAKSAKQCSLDMLKNDRSAPTVSLFKQKRIKGWWPFYGTKDKDDPEHLELTGKVEAELQLLTKEEAERTPVGFGRSEPDPLEKPNRPDSSFLWVLNPLKSIRYIVWNNYKWILIKGICFLLLVLMLAIFVYSIPGYTVKKMIGA